MEHKRLKHDMTDDELRQWGRDTAAMSSEEVLDELHEWIEEIKAEEVAFEENAAVHAPDDGLTTDQRALAALERPERFAGEHDVARAWLKSSPTARVWNDKRSGDE